MAQLIRKDGTLSKAGQKLALKHLRETFPDFFSDPVRREINELLWERLNDTIGSITPLELVHLLAAVQSIRFIAYGAAKKDSTNYYAHKDYESPPIEEILRDALKEST